MFLDKALWAFALPVRGRIAASAFVGVLAAVVGAVRLGLLGWLIASIFRGSSFQDLLIPFALVALVMVLRGYLDYARTMIAHRTAARVQTALRARLYDKVIELGPAHFGLERTGDVLLSLVEGVEQLEVWFGEYLPQVLVALITPLVIFALLATLDLPIALVLLAFAVGTLLAPSLFHRWDSANSKARQVAYAEFAAEFLDSIQGLATLKAFGQSKAAGKTLAKKAHAVFRATMWVLATNTLSRGITDTGIALGAAVTLIYGAQRVASGAMSIDVLLIVLMVGIEAYRPQRDLRGLLHNGMMGQAAASGIAQILETPPQVPPPASPLPADTSLEPSVTFSGVSFAYPQAGRPTYEALSFSAAPGQCVAFVGPSGAGKSTILKLLLRLYEPDEGRIEIGGVSLNDLSAESIHRHLAVVTQDTYLFHGTVAENLRFGRDGATDDEMIEAAKLANAHRFIEGLPQGYHTVIGERGVRLSGGQRQRVAIARAILADAPILVLDEALSAVDAENESVIQDALQRLMQGRTTIVFAHRLSSVKTLM